MDRDDTDTLIQGRPRGVMIDTFNDERRAFQFRRQPAGRAGDAVFSEQTGVEDFSWDMIWNAVSRITADGYIVEAGVSAEAVALPVWRRAADLGLEAFRFVAAQRPPSHLLAGARPQQGMPALPEHKGITAISSGGLGGPSPGRKGAQIVRDTDPTVVLVPKEQLRTDEARPSPEAG